jgi:hypothetical protein
VAHVGLGLNFFGGVPKIGTKFLSFATENATPRIAMPQKFERDSAEETFELLRRSPPVIARRPRLKPLATEA